MALTLAISPHGRLLLEVEGILKPALEGSTIAQSDLADVFGIELEGEPLSQSTSAASSQPPASPVRSKRLPQAAKRRKAVKPKAAPKRRPVRQPSHELL